MVGRDGADMIVKRLHVIKVEHLKDLQVAGGFAKAHEGPWLKGVAELKQAVGCDVLAGWSRFSLTTLACFLFPCSCLAAGDGKNAILWCVLDHLNRYTKDNQCSKNKSNHKNERPIL